MNMHMIYGDDEKERKARQMAQARRRREEKHARKQLCLILFLILGIAGLLAASVYTIKIRTEQRKTEIVHSTENLAAQSTYAEQGEELVTANTEVLETIGEEVTSGTDSTANGTITVGDVQFVEGFTAEETQNTAAIAGDSVISSYAILVDASTNEIVAQKNAKTKICPASMTKILTVLVAAEHVENLDDTIPITLEYTDYAYVNDCSAVGFLENEVVPIRDLFYGTILPSGADAAIALATYVAGSHEAFVDMMNAKLEELGLSESSHFTNCVGIYEEDHYSTVYDMAMILKAAVQNDFCREVLSEHVYTTALTEQHPEGIIISNWFLRRIEDHDTGGLVLCAKTGTVAQSGSCAASYEITDSGNPYICVTADATSSWTCIDDHIAIYNAYAK